MVEEHRMRSSKCQIELAKQTTKHFVPWVCFHQQLQSFFHVTTCLEYAPFLNKKLPLENKRMALNPLQSVTVYSHVNLSVQACVTFLLRLSSGLKVAKRLYLSKGGELQLSSSKCRETSAFLWQMGAENTNKATVKTRLSKHWWEKQCLKKVSFDTLLL